MNKLNTEQIKLLYKEADFGRRGNQLVAALAALSALTSITWATTSLSDRAARQKWQKKLETKLQSRGINVDKAFLANLQPTIALQEEMPKVSSLHMTDGQARKLYKEARTRWGRDLTKIFKERARLVKAFQGSPEDLVRMMFASPGVGKIPRRAVAPRSWLGKLFGLNRNVLSDQAMRKMIPVAKKYLRNLPRHTGWAWGGRPERPPFDLNKFLKGIYG